MEWSRCSGTVDLLALLLNKEDVMGKPAFRIDPCSYYINSSLVEEARGIIEESDSVLGEKFYNAGFLRCLVVQFDKRSQPRRDRCRIEALVAQTAPFPQGKPGLIACKHHKLNEHLIQELKEKQDSLQLGQKSKNGLRKFGQSKANG